MIESWGYTEDGLVFMRINIEMAGKPGVSTLLLTPEDARSAAKALREAAEEAEKRRKVH